MDDDAKVYLALPKPLFLATVEQYALLLSTLRRMIPRVHYAMPVFAAFCRGEEILGQDLVILGSELDALQKALKAATNEDWVRLVAQEDAKDPQLYRRSHFRGRTFDRRCVEPVPVAEQQDFTVALALGRGPSLFEVFEPLMNKIQTARADANNEASVLQQRASSFHRVPSATEW